MLSRFFSTILSVALLANIMSASLIQLSFSWNKEYIVETLCVNKDNNNSNCMGSCYLSKQLKENKKNKKEENPLESSTKLLQFFFPESFSSFKNVFFEIFLGQIIGRAGFVQKGFINQLEFPPEF